MIKNGDLPAMPTIYADMAVNGQREIYCDQTGLTKREQFAMAAPEAPSWFKTHLHKSDLLYRQAESEGIAEGGSYLFFAWRTYYADKLLAELERAK